MAVYQSEFQGATIDARLAAVATMQTAISNLETAVAAKYSKPASGIPETDLDAAVQSALALARTAVQSLSDYYTKAQVDAITAAIAASVDSTSGVVVTTLPSAGAGTLGKIYYVGPDGSGFYDRYVTSYDGSTYSWLALGNTEVDMTQYATVEQLNQLDQEVAGLKLREFSVSTGRDYSADTLQIPCFIKQGQTYKFGVHDKTSVSSGKYALRLYYSDGTVGNPTNPDLNTDYTGTASKDILAVGAYISSGKITTAGTLELSLIVNGTVGAENYNTREAVAVLVPEVENQGVELTSKVFGELNKSVNVAPGVLYEFPDLYFPFKVTQGKEFSFLFENITAESSGAYALRQFYSDGTYENTSSNPVIGTKYTGTAAKNIIAFAIYLSTGKVTAAGTMAVIITNTDSIEKRLDNVAAKIYTIGQGKDFSTFTQMLRGLANVPGKKIVYVEGGTYDIYEEIGGDAYLATLDPSQLEWTDVVDFVPENTTIIGMGTVVLKWLPTAQQIGSDAMANLFSPLNVKWNNCRIENITIDCQNCRYGIHDETRAETKGTLHEYINVKVVHREETYGLKYAYGAGHGGKSRRYFRDCEFVAYFGNVWSSHDWAAPKDEGSEFIFENCLIYDPRDATHTPLLFTSSDTVGRVDKVFLSNCYIPNKIRFTSGGSSQSYNQAYEVVMIGCNEVTATRADNIINPIEIRQYLTR